MWIEYASIFFTFSQIKQFATQKQFRKFNRQYLKIQQTVLSSPDSPCQTVLKFLEVHARQFWIFSAFYSPLIHNSFSSVCVFIKVLEGNSHWIFICDFLLSCHVKNTMSEIVCLYFILRLHSLDSFRLAVFVCKNWEWVGNPSFDFSTTI